LKELSMRRRVYVFGALIGAVSALVAVSGPYAYRYWVSGTPRDPARKQAIANYHRIVRAQYDYHKEHGAFPAGITTEKTVGLSWRVQLLPYLGENALYEQFKLTEPWDSPANLPLIEKMPAVFASPGKPATPGHTFVRTTQGPGGMIYVTPGARLPDYAVPGTHLKSRSIGRNNNISDGTSNTIMFVEAGEAVPWTKPDELTLSFTAAEPSNQSFNLPRFGGVFDGGFHVALVDGSVLFLRHDYPERHLAAMLTPSGGESFTDADLREITPGMRVYSVGLPPPELPTLWKPGEW
jgi:hypothetical protein